MHKLTKNFLLHNSNFSTTMLFSLPSVVMFIYGGCIDKLSTRIHSTILMLTHQIAPPVLCPHFCLYCKCPLLPCKQSCNHASVLIHVNTNETNGKHCLCLSCLCFFFLCSLFLFSLSGEPSMSRRPVSSGVVLS